VLVPRPPHVLVVDARSDIFELLSPGFKELQCRITHVRDVAAAKQIIDGGLVDVILVDTRLLNAVGAMLVGQAAFVPLLPLANYGALNVAVRSRLRRPPAARGADPAAIDLLVRWIGDALRTPEFETTATAVP
jgi:DNA-binding NtrC family response regulator